MATLYDSFKDFLVQLVEDPDVVRKHAALHDEDYKNDQIARIRALTPDVVVRLNYNDVISQLGLAYKDVEARSIRFVPKGFSTTLSAFREGNVSTPRRLWRRAAPTDGIQYLLADGGDGALTGNGVFLLSESLEVLSRFPFYGPNTAGGEYDDAGAVVAFTIGTVEYIAIACTDKHVVQIYEYNAPFTHIATIGSPGVSGADATHLDSPWALAVDETNGRLFIGCKAGQPVLATAPNGFIAIWDVSFLPAAPTFTSIPFFYANSGNLFDREVNVPTDLFFENNLLWTVNGGNSTVGAFDVSGTIFSCVRYLESAGNGYTLRNPGQIAIKSDLGNFKSIFIANTDTGTIEEFNYQNLRHSKTYGIRASEDGVGSYHRFNPQDIYGALGAPVGVVADTVRIEDQDTRIFIAADTLNKRLHRFNEDAYDSDNYVNFRVLTFEVPISVTGWALNGTVPINMVKVYYKFSELEEWKVLPQEISLPASSTLQIKLTVELDTRRFVREWEAFSLVIIGEQA